MAIQFLYPETDISIVNAIDIDTDLLTDGIYNHEVDEGIPPNDAPSDFIETNAGIVPYGSFEFGMGPLFIQHNTAETSGVVLRVAASAVSGVAWTLGGTVDMPIQFKDNNGDIIAQRTQPSGIRVDPTLGDQQVINIPLFDLGPKTSDWNLDTTSIKLWASGDLRPSEYVWDGSLNIHNKSDGERIFTYAAHHTSNTVPDKDVAVDSSGYAYAVRERRQANGPAEAYLIKTDPNGNTVFTRNAVNSEGGFAIVTDNRFLYIAASSGSTEIYDAAKRRLDGQLVWGHNLLFADEFSGVGVDSSGSSVFINGNAGVTTDGFVKIGEDGSILFRKNTDSYNDVTIDPSDNIIMAVSPSSSDFTNGIANNVKKFNQYGVEIWESGDGGIGNYGRNNAAVGVATDSSGNIYANSEQRLFKLDSDGTLLWTTDNWLALQGDSFRMGIAIDEPNNRGFARGNIVDSGIMAFTLDSGIPVWGVSGDFMGIGVDVTDNQFVAPVQGAVIDSLEVRVTGDATSHSGIPLFIEGAISNNSGIDLFMDGIGRPSGNMDLYMMGPETPHNSGHFLFAEGHLPHNSGHTLFIHGITTYNESMNLFVRAIDPVADSGNTDLFVWSTAESGLRDTTTLFLKADGLTGAPSEGMNIFIGGIGGETADTSNMNLFMKGLGDVSGFQDSTATTTLFVQNDAVLDTGNVNLFMKGPAGTSGAIPHSSTMNLFISRQTESISHVHSLYICGPSGYNEGMELFIHAQPSSNSGIPMFMSSPTILDSGFTTLYSHGF